MTTPAPPMPPARFQAIADTLRRFGWEDSAAFWERYHSDVYVYNLTNALARTAEKLDEVERERRALEESRQ